MTRSPRGRPGLAVCSRSQENRGRRDLGNTQEATGSRWRASPGAHLRGAGDFWRTVLCGQHRSRRLSPGCISHPRDDGSRDVLSVSLLRMSRPEQRVYFVHDPRYFILCRKQGRVSPGLLEPEGNVQHFPFLDVLGHRGSGISDQDIGVLEGALQSTIKTPND